ncbi:50S ribosomal protein L11 [Sesbania bispinosa]|nr:50S ribosomal protein L11 [Sesbania bispinosa]
MAGRAQEKLAEKLARKQLKDAQKKGGQVEVSGSETSVTDLITRKRPRVQIPVPPPQNKPEGHGPSKGSSSTTLHGDRGKASEERLKELKEQVAPDAEEKGPDGVVNSVEGTSSPNAEMGLKSEGSGCRFYL